MYFESLDEKKVTDNKLFSKAVKPSLSNKLFTNNRTNLIKMGDRITSELKTVNVLNKYFSNLIKVGLSSPKNLFYLLQ